MCWLTNSIRQKGKQEGRNETLLTAYINMKQADCKDNYIFAMLGISASKLQQIKKMAAASPASV